MAPELSVVIPALNAALILPACLDALAAQHQPPPHEVIVVDNGSSDATSAIARAHPAVDRVVTCDRPGSYAARNAGVAASVGDVVAFTDADCRPNAAWLAAGCAAVRAGSHYVAGVIDVELGSDPTLWSRYDRATYLNQASYVHDLSFGATANLFVHRALFDQIGLFDERLRSGGDVELGLRAKEHGHLPTLCAEAVVSHPARSRAREIWQVHRRLGAGWAALADGGAWPRMLLDPALWIPPPQVLYSMMRDERPLPVKRAALVHAFAMTARWVGRLTGRG